MGRQAHVTRLALGRSPFGEPFRDENGDFILGPHAHDNEASGYRQQFDDRGHPQNRLSKATARRLRRAQNDVLATVGVVVRKGEERKTRWEKMDDRAKQRLIYHENQRGRELKGEDRLFGLLLPWCIISLRRRLMTFGPYLVVPLTELVRREYHVLGLRRLLLAGLSFHLLAIIPQLNRNYIADPDVEEIVNFVNPWRPERSDPPLASRLWRIGKNILIPFLEFPLTVHATLQTLSIMPADAGVSLRLFNPFSESFPWSMRTLPGVINSDTILEVLSELSHEPLLLYMAQDYLQTQLHYRLYALFRQVFTKPDRPDPNSAFVADETEEIEETSIAGVGYPWPKRVALYERGKRYFGPRSFLGAFRVAFPWLYMGMNFVSGGQIARSRGHLTPLLERQLRVAVRDKYWDERSIYEPPPRRGSPEDIDLRQRVVDTVFASANLNPNEELVDSQVWTNDTLGPKADVLRVQPADPLSWNNRSDRILLPGEDALQAENNRRQNDAANSVIAQAFEATPTSDAVVIQANDGQIVMATQRAPHDALNVADMNNIHTIQAADVPLEVLLHALESMEEQPDQPQLQRQYPDLPQELQLTQHLQTSGEPQAPSSRPRSPSPPLPPTPTPGISRAPSLTDPSILAPSSQPLRPLRRPTETDDSLATISETLRAEAESLRAQSPTTDRPVTEPDGDRPPLSTVATETRPRTPQPQTLHQAIENETLPPMPDPLLVPQKHRKYRVTMFSNHPADSLAWHSSALLTSLILWPMEAMWLRSVARWAVNTPALAGVVDPWWSARLGLGVLQGEAGTVGILGLNTWFGGAESPGDRMRYVTGILLTLGLEGLVRGACWSAGLYLVKRWKGKYGWGQF